MLYVRAFTGAAVEDGARGFKGVMQLESIR